MEEKRECPLCSGEIITKIHWEYDGDQGSKEPYEECINGCEFNDDKESEVL